MSRIPPGARPPRESDLYPGVIIGFPKFVEVGDLIMEIGDVNNLLLVLVTSPPTTNRLQWEPVITGTIVSTDHRITLGVEWTCRKSVILLENQTSPPSPWRLEKEST